MGVPSGYQQKLLAGDGLPEGIALNSQQTNLANNDTADINGVGSNKNNANNVVAYQKDPIGTELPMDISFPTPPYPGAQQDQIGDLMYWGQQTNNPFKRGLLRYTQEIVNNSTNVKGSKGRYIGVIDSQLNLSQTTNNDGEGTEFKHSLVSKGNEVKGEDNLYCRSWSTRRPFYTRSNLIRNEELIRGKYSNEVNYSVLQDGGHVKIGWEKDGNWEKRLQTQVTTKEGSSPIIDQLRAGNAVQGVASPYMLSLENLAWKSSPHMKKIPDCEVGPNGGRIMWFPPYNLEFSENNSVNWEKTDFIGRPESIYTYNNSERSGNLGFTILVDHPSILNEMRSRTADELRRFFAGCEDIENTVLSAFISPQEQEILNKTQNDGTLKTDPNGKTDPDGDVGKIPAENFFQPTPVELDGFNFCPRDPSNTVENGCLKVFFQNARTDATPTAINTTGMGRSVDLVFDNGFETSQTVPILSGCTSENYRNGFNYEIQTILDKLCEFLVTESGKYYTIKIIGNASYARTTAYNLKLACDRASTVYDYMYNKMNGMDKDITMSVSDVTSTGKKIEVAYPKESEWKVVNSKVTVSSPNEDFAYGKTDAGMRWVLVSGGESASEFAGGDEDTIKETDPTCLKYTDPSNLDEDSPFRIKERNVQIILTKNPDLTPWLKQKINKDKTESMKNDGLTDDQIKTSNDQPTSNGSGNNQDDQVIKNITARIISECDYFKKIEKDSPFIYNSIKEKIDYFHPSFHSITPEGFNNRLTFLLQCTRQGPQINDTNMAQNLVFGRPPICVLRIGDFYHTKIVIDSVNFTYETMQLDLNPEGIGVQPMIVKVDIGFKFIGGSSLAGPITQLQNAVSFNYFANTSIYRPAEKFTDDKGKSWIYGSFSSPSEEADLVSKVVEANAKLTNTSTNNQNKDTKSSETSTDVKEKIDNATNNTPTNQTTKDKSNGDKGTTTSNNVENKIETFTTSASKVKIVKSDGSDLNTVITQNGDIAFGINGTIYNSLSQTKGLLISDGLEYNSLNIFQVQAGGDGNWNTLYKQGSSAGQGDKFRNGVLVINNSGSVSIVPYSDASLSNLSGVVNAIQGGPILKLNNAINNIFDPNSTNLFSRTGVGVTSSGQIKFAWSFTPMNLSKFTEEAFSDCTDALYLDGGAVTTIWKDGGLLPSSVGSSATYILTTP